MSQLIEYFDRLLNESMGSTRYTQNSPVLPNVWLEFAKRAGQPHDVILTPHFETRPMDLAKKLRSRLEEFWEEDAKHYRQLNKLRDLGPRVAYNETSVVATLWFREIIQVVLPLSEWWSSQLLGGENRDVAETFMGSAEDREAVGHLLVAGMEKMSDQAKSGRLARPQRMSKTGPDLSPDLAWLGMVVGSLAILEEEALKSPPVQRAGARPGSSTMDDTALNMLRAVDDDHVETPYFGAIVDALFPILETTMHVELPETPLLWQINLNRSTETSVYRSARTIKADAVQSLFDVRGKGIRWAVIDSGIDATHIAFRKRDAEGRPLGPRIKVGNKGSVEGAIENFSLQGEPELAKNRVRRNVDTRQNFWGAFVPKPPPASQPGAGNFGPKPKEEPKREDKWINQTRIVRTFDFTHFRDLVSAESVDNLTLALKEKLKRLKKSKTVDADFEADLNKALQFGRLLEWDLLAPLLEVPHNDAYQRPNHDHGTHVAGIIGADWRADEHPYSPSVDRTGMAPEIELFDLRALREDGQGDEFTILAAMQFVRGLNSSHNKPQVHGVNLSFSIRHDVASFACGRTPVCEEAERLVGSGIVVVAAAGNSGRARYLTTDDGVDEGYRAASITDPGNTASVITVGATHRENQHNYGVSYFSSRGPTGDGRMKPDLVAPGERIYSTIPENAERDLDGTSMAAPHVSGAVALLLERHAELVGQPAKVKEILCEAATDLGRERYYQGHGALDVLRALQSV